MTPAIRPAHQKPGLFEKLGAGMTRLWQSGAINHLFRLIAIGIALALLVFVLLATVLWNADFYTARDHWEHFKIAMFSPWQKAGKCLPNIYSPECDRPAAPDQAMGELEFSLFKQTPIDGSPLTVTIGASFDNAEDAKRGEANTYWCYIHLDQGILVRKVTLASQNRGEEVAYTDLSLIDESALETSPFNHAQLAALAQSHCQFSSETFAIDSEGTF